MTQAIRAGLITAAAAGCLVYAFIPPGNPTWIGLAGSLLGGEALVRARGDE